MLHAVRLVRRERSFFLVDLGQRRISREQDPAWQVTQIDRSRYLAGQAPFDELRSEAHSGRRDDWWPVGLLPLEAKPRPTCTVDDVPLDRDMTAGRRQGAILGRIGGKLVKR